VLYNDHVAAVGILAIDQYLANHVRRHQMVLRMPACSWVKTSFLQSRLHFYSLHYDALTIAIRINGLLSLPLLSLLAFLLRGMINNDSVGFVLSASLERGRDKR